MTRHISTRHQYHYALQRYRDAAKVSSRASAAMMELSQVYDRDQRLHRQQVAASQRSDEALVNRLGRQRHKLAQQALTLKIQVTRGCKP